MPALGSDPGRGNLVDLDVPLWAWGALFALIGLMLAVDLFRHRDDHEPTRRGTLVESLM